MYMLKSTTLGLCYPRVKPLVFAKKWFAAMAHRAEWISNSSKSTNSNIILVTKQVLQWGRLKKKSRGRKPKATVPLRWVWPKINRISLSIQGQFSSSQQNLFWGKLLMITILAWPDFERIEKGTWTLLRKSISSSPESRIIYESVFHLSPGSGK
jgi:hypothetical protein